MKKPTHDAAALKQAARSRWAEILPALGSVDAGMLDGKNRPCPKCGSTDRFRFTDKDGDGSVFCNQCGKGIGDGIAALMWLRGWTFPEAVKALAEHLGHSPQAAGGGGTAGASNGKPRIVATYDYRDENGNLLFQVVRFDPKDFRQRRPENGGGWAWSVKGVRMVPYRLPKLLAAPADRVIVIPEGEKDVGVLQCPRGRNGKATWRPCGGLVEVGRLPGGCWQTSRRLWRSCGKRNGCANDGSGSTPFGEPCPGDRCPRAGPQSVR